MRGNVFVIVSGVLALAYAAYAADEQRGIVPGEGIGPLRLGATMHRIDRILGKADFGDATLGHAFEFWRVRTKRGIYEISVKYRWGGPNDHDRVAEEILATDPAFRTGNGISTASGLKAIWSAYPNLEYEGVLSTGGTPPIEVYDDKAAGIQFELLRTGKKAVCYAVVVYKPGEDAGFLGTFAYSVSGYNKVK